ncbi:MAG: hypothetical protein AAGB13_17715 [Cyanobacteria bacterium P01_F01_bin.33]
MTRINSGLLLSALALGTAAIFSSTPAEARPAIVERLAEINTRGTTKDHGGLAYSERSVSILQEKPVGVWTASGDGFSSSVDEDTFARPAIVRRLAELNVAGTEKDHGGLAFSSRVAAHATERPEGVWSASGDGFSVAVDDEVGGRPAIVRRLAEINVRGTDKDHGGLSFNSRTLR